MSKENIDLLIIEKGENLKFSKESDYTFEGPFTSFGVKNKNRRIYEKKGFLPHLKSLQEQISSNKLLGELDHPKDFEIMLSRSSHVIENLSLDESGDTVIGKIKLLDTAKGKDAKAISDAGVPLHISSRAAGTVNEEGVVQIKKLFTYDLVADPGFANAKLEKVAESLNVDEAKAQEIMDMVTESHTYDSSELKLINEQFGLTEEDGIEIYQVVKKANEAIKEDKDTKVKKEDLLEKESKEKVTVEQLTKWSNVFVEEIQSMVEKKMVEANEANTDLSKMKEYMTTFSNEVNEKFNQFNSFVDYLSEGMNQLKDHNNHIVEGMTGLKDHNNYLVEGMNTLKDHNNYLVENLNLVKGYSEKAHMEIGDLKEHNDHLVEMSNKLAEFTNHIGEKTNQSINYAENISIGAAKLTEFVEHIAENVHDLKEGNTNFQEKIEDFQDKATEEKAPETQVSESSTSEYKDALSIKLDAILENAKKASEEAINKTSTEENVFGLLNETYQSQIETLPEDKKQKLTEVFEGEEKPSSESEASELFDSIVNENKGLNWKDNMPENVKSTWEKLDETVKAKIELQANQYELDTQARIDWFWSTRTLHESKKPVLNKAINESKNLSNNSLGYQVNPDNFIKAVKNIHG